MAFVDMVNAYGEKVKIRVCDYCKTVCVPGGSRYCSGHCARNADERAQQKAMNELKAMREGASHAD